VKGNPHYYRDVILYGVPEFLLYICDGYYLSFIIVLDYKIIQEKHILKNFIRVFCNGRTEERGGFKAILGIILYHRQGCDITDFRLKFKYDKDLKSIENKVIFKKI
jgi:hypothetical protein